jgi:hypothetical protein
MLSFLLIFALFAIVVDQRKQISVNVLFTTRVFFTSKVGVELNNALFTVVLRPS